MATDFDIMKFEIHNEMDVMLSHRRAMQFAKFSGMLLAEQTRFATAVSELCRNVLEHATNGLISFKIRKTTDQTLLEAVIEDKGKGINSLKEIMRRNPDTHKGRGLGLVYAHRLSDTFNVSTNSKGTSVVIQKIVPGKNKPIGKVIVDGWVKHLQSEPAISAYEELKIRNIQLLDLTDQLTANNRMVEKQMQEIQLLNTRLADNNSRMKDFTYAISHDLKNPLSSLKLATEQLDIKGLDAAAGVYVGVISRSVNRLDKTIHSLIEILDTQNQNKHITKKLDFRKLLDEIKDAQSESIAATGTTISADFSLASTINYIEGYLTSIFHNLISNAIKYRSPDRSPEIIISTSVADDMIVLSVTDNGLGLDLAKITHQLFKPFSRFHATVEGNGIGLYLIKGMIENNGGSIDVESELGKGTRFIIKLKQYPIG